MMSRLATNRILINGVNLLRRRRRERARQPGLPDGLDFVTVDEICHQHLGKGLNRVSHEHISSWKKAGSYRLFLTLEDGTPWRLIFKDAIYDVQNIPALSDLPVSPGPPEYHIYKNVRGPLAAYLPVVYQCLELVPGTHYQYALEDLGQDFQRPVDAHSIVAMATRLPAFHRAIDDWYQTVNRGSLLTYGPYFSSALVEYANTNLEQYLRSYCVGIVSEVCDLLPKISTIFERENGAECCRLSVIHGDFNPSNLLIDKRNPERFKLIDWEWGGLGLAHADLASLLARVSGDVEEHALDSFLEQSNHLPVQTHRRTYLFCKLQRHLLDVSFMAAQQLGVGTENDFHGIIEASAQRALDAFRQFS